MKIKREIETKVESANFEMEQLYENRAIKYSHLLIKRFFANPEKYI